MVITVLVCQLMISSMGKRKRSHHCTECGSHNRANCIRLGHLAECEVCKRAFQVASQGCTLHPYTRGYNEEHYNSAHKNGMWHPPEQDDQEAEAERQRAEDEERQRAEQEEQQAGESKGKKKTGKNGKKQR